MATDSGIPPLVKGLVDCAQDVAEPHFVARVRIDPFTPGALATTRHPVGCSLADVLERLGLANDETTNVLFEGTAIPPDRRAGLRLKAGRVVVVEPTPGGPAIGAAIALSGGATAGGSFFAAPMLSVLGEALLPSLLAAGTLFDSRALLDRAFGTHSAGAGAAQENTRTLSGANAFRAYEQVPVVLGKKRFLGAPTAMQPFEEREQNQTYYNTVICWGHADVELEDIRIGNDQLSEHDVQVQHDLTGQGGIKWAPRTNNPRLNVTLSSDWHEYRTPSRATSLEVKVRLFGPGAYTAQQTDTRQSGTTIWRNEYYKVTSAVQIEYKRQSDTTWTPWPTATYSSSRRTLTGQYSAAYVPDRNVSILIDGGVDNQNTNGPRLPLREAVYDVRVKITTTQQAGIPSNATIRQGGRLTGLVSKLNEIPVQVDGVALSRFRVGYSEKARGIVREISAIVGTKMPLYQGGGAWGTDKNNPRHYGVSTNPADIYRFVLSSESINRYPIPLAQVDDRGLGEWHEFCRENEFEYSQIITGRQTRGDVLGEIAKAGRAIPMSRNGKRGVYINQAQGSITQVITPNSGIDGTFSQTADLEPLPHAVRVAFADAQQDWADSEIVVYDHGYSKTGKEAGKEKAIRIERVSFGGVTSQKAAYKLGRYYLNTIRHRAREIRIAQNEESLLAELGDWVVFAHPGALASQVSGRVKSITGEAGAPPAYGDWSSPIEKSPTAVKINFNTFNPGTQTQIGAFLGGSTGLPDDWRYDGVYATWVEGSSQFLIVGYGNPLSGSSIKGGKALRARVRRGNGWSAWSDWGTGGSTSGYEASDANRVDRQSGRPALFQIGVGGNTPTTRLIDGRVSQVGAWAILEDFPYGSGATKQNLYLAYYGRRTWSRNVTAGSAKADVVLDEAVTFEAGKSYDLSYMPATGGAVTTGATGAVGTQSKVTLENAGGLEVGNQFTFAERGKILQCVVTSKTPVGDGRAYLTMQPVQNSDFTDTPAPDYESNISRPLPTQTLRGPVTPFVFPPIGAAAAAGGAQGQGGAVGLNEPVVTEVGRVAAVGGISQATAKGEPIPTITVEFEPGDAPPLNNRVTVPVTASVRYKLRGTDDQYEYVTAPAEQGVARITGVLVGREYDVGVQMLDAEGNSSEWVPQVRSAEGLDVAPPPVDSLTAEITGETTTVSWRHVDAPRTIAGYEIRESYLKGVRNWDRGISSVGSVPSESRSKTVPTTGGTFMIKPFDAFGNYASSATFVDAPSVTPAIPQLEVSNVSQNPTWAGTKNGVAVRNATLQLARIPAVSSGTSIDDLPPIDDWAPIDDTRPEQVVQEGTYIAPVVDLGDIYSVIAVPLVEMAGSSSISNFMANVQRMSDLKNFAGDASEDSTRVSVDVRFAETRTGTAGNFVYAWLGGGWVPLSRSRITGRFLQMRLSLLSTDPFITPIVTKLSLQILAEQRTLTAKSLQTSTAGAGNYLFPVAFQQTPAAGDNVTVIPVFSADNPNLAAGDKIVLSNVGAKGFSMAAVNAQGNNVQRNVDYMAEGYGTEVDATP